MELKKRVVNFRLTDRQYQLAQTKAQSEGLTLSQKMRWFVRQWIANDEEQEEADLDLLKEHQEFEIEAGARDEVAVWLL